MASPRLTLLLRTGSFIQLLFVIACGDNQGNQPEQWDHARIDSTINQDPAYRQLDKESEVFSLFEEKDSSQKRTSGVAYFTKGHVNLSDSPSARFNNCRAYLYHNTLSIHIGIGNGFGGWGFSIRYNDKKFYTEPYYVTDVVVPGAPEPVYEMVYQKLTLNKPVYQAGDSLYGNVDFKCFEADRDKNRIAHSGKGYFRTIVKAP